MMHDDLMMYRNRGYSKQLVNTQNDTHIIFRVNQNIYGVDRCIFVIVCIVYIKREKV